MQKIMIPAYQRDNILPDLMLIADDVGITLRTCDNGGPFYFLADMDETARLMDHFSDFGIKYHFQ